MRTRIVWLVLLLSQAPLALALPAKHAPVAATPAALRPKHLSEINELTKILAPGGTIDEKELERLLENAEAVSLRDTFARPSAQAITYAGALDRSIDTLRGERPLRVLLDLALVLATFANPADDFRQRSYADAFYKALLKELKVPDTDARTRPELLDELAQIGNWAADMTRYYAPRLPADQSRMIMMRLYLTVGNYAPAIELGRAHLDDPRIAALLGAALLFDGRALADGNARLVIALGHGGEAAAIARWAWREATRRRVMHELGRAFGDRDVGADGGVAMCRQAATPSAEQAQACAARFWLAGDQVAAIATVDKTKLTPSWTLLKSLVDLATTKDADRKTTLRKDIVNELVPLQLGDHDRRLLRVAVDVSAAFTAHEPSLFTLDDRATLDKLSQETPCDPVSLPLRFLAIRGDRNELATYADNIATTCNAQPTGIAATVEAATILLEMAHSTATDTGAQKAKAALPTIEKSVFELATRHANDPALLGLKADVLVLRGLRNDKARPTAFMAALAVYEDALSRLSPLAGTLRTRLESNAAFVATSMWTTATKVGRVDLERRALKHLRLAVALGDQPLTQAVRAKFGTQTKLVSSGVQPERWPSGPGKRRALCLLAEQAQLANDRANAQRYAAMQKNEPPADHDLVSSEIIVDASGAVSLLVDDRSVVPLVEARTALWFVPACE